MPNKGLTHIYVLTDRSGSMRTIRDDVIGGFNTFLEDQQEIEGECFLTYAQFDDIYEELFKARDIKKVEPLNKDTFVPRGCTALLDAWGRSIGNLKERIVKMNEEDKPDNIIFVVITDGRENASDEITRSQLFKMVEEAKEEGWSFTFLAANQDAVKEGGKYGIPAESTLDFSCDSKSVSTSYGLVSKGVRNIRTKSLKGFHYSDQEKAEAMGDTRPSDVTKKIDNE